MSMFRKMSLSRIGVVALLCAVASTVWAADGAPGLVRTAEGKWNPASGYVWVAPSDQRNLELRVRPDLWVDHYDGDGRPFFAPRSGDVWVDPQQLTTRTWAGLRLTGVDQAGNSWFVAAPGYVWDGDPQKNNMRIKLRARAKTNSQIG